MKPVRRTALQGEAIGDGEAIQGLGKGLDRSRYGGTRKGEPSQVRASQKTKGNQARGNETLGRSSCSHPLRRMNPTGEPCGSKRVQTGAVACGACRSLEEVAPSAEHRVPGWARISLSRCCWDSPERDEGIGRC